MRDYIEGLDKDFWQILEYFGRDFIEPKKKRPPLYLEYQENPAGMVPIDVSPLLTPEIKSPVLPLKLS